MARPKQPPVVTVQLAEPITASLTWHLFASINNQQAAMCNLACSLSSQDRSIEVLSFPRPMKHRDALLCRCRRLGFGYSGSFVLFDGDIADVVSVSEERGITLELRQEKR